MRQLTLLACSIFCLTLSTSALAAPPNIVLLLADDLGWTGVGCYGSDFYETPNIDKLASQGMKFTDAYAACTVCSPTRASIMTGMYPARLRLTDFIAGQNRPFAKLQIPDWTKKLNSNHKTIAELLKQKGYRTAHVGKWHLDAKGSNSRGATAHGFDETHTKPSRTKGYHLPFGANLDGESKSEYLTDYLTDRAIRFIDSNKRRPFFLYFAYHTPHTPIQGRKDLVKRFENKLNKLSDAPIHKNPKYAAMVNSLDQSVGRIIERLKQHKLDSNTIVVFTSDNGGLTQRYGKHDGFTENLPLRRGKGSAYEGGVRVPAIVRWTGVTPAGSVSTQPIITTDYYPTFAEAAGASKESNQKLDGKNLGPLLRNPDEKLDRDLFWHYPHYHAGGDSPYSAIRSGKWRLVQFHEDQRIELYDLSKDLGETNNLAADQPMVATQLSRRLAKWRTSIKAQMPTENPDYDPARATQVKRNRRRR